MEGEDGGTVGKEMKKREREREERIDREKRGGDDGGTIGKRKEERSRRKCRH